MARHSVIYLKYILFGHICGLILMFGLTPILQDNLFDFVPKTIQIFKQKTFSLFPFYFWIVAGLIALYLVWFLLIKNIIKIGQHCCGTNSKFAKLKNSIGNRCCR